MSQQIQKLEAEMGQPLFDRLPRTVILTEAGRCLLEFARKILASVADARRCVDEVKGEVAGRLGVGAIPTIAPYVQIVEPAVGAGRIGMGLKQKVMIGLIIGLFVAILMAFFLEYLDQTIKTTSADRRTVTATSTKGTSGLVRQVETLSTQANGAVVDSVDNFDKNGDVLNAVKQRTGAAVEMPLVSSERVVGKFGPGALRR